MELRSSDQGVFTLYFVGDLSLCTGVQLWQAARNHAARVARGQTLNFDLSRAWRVEPAAIAMLVHVQSELVQRGVSSQLSSASPHVQELIRMHVPSPTEAEPTGRHRLSTLAQIGAASASLWRETQIGLAFLGQAAVATLRVLRDPKRGNFREVPRLMERVGADALPIVALINFLVGLVMAFQASVQLKRFGANILVADLIGISMTRELGPLMTAIVLSGRSGAAFAAELGTMRVNEEIDALRVLGLSPMAYLVLPRVLAMFVVLPLLAFFADLVGILGGLVVAVTRLDLTSTAYLRQTAQAVKLWDVYSGAIKAAVFAVAITLIACQQGLAATGGAEGVGKRTTAAVVVSLFMLILIDATFTVMFRLTGL